MRPEADVLHGEVEVGVWDDDEGRERRRVHGRGQSSSAASAALPLHIVRRWLGPATAEDRPAESLEDLRILAVLSEHAACRRPDGSDLGGVAAAVGAHQQMEPEREAAPPRRSV